MAKKELLGHIACGCCAFADAEVREDKNGNPYVYCPYCNAQLLTHGRAERTGPLLRRMRPVAPAVSVTEAKPAAPAPAAASEAKGKPEPKPAPSAPPAPVKKRASHFLMG